MESFERLHCMWLIHGKDAYYSGRFSAMVNMFKDLAKTYNLSIKKWNLNNITQQVSFVNAVTGVKYNITFGYERNDYYNAFKNYEVVMYHGHSRYGRGPAFEKYTNYFRIGTKFPGIEVSSVISIVPAI